MGQVQFLQVTVIDIVRGQLLYQHATFHDAYIGPGFLGPEWGWVKPFALTANELDARRHSTFDI